MCQPVIHRPESAAGGLGQYVVDLEFKRTRQEVEMAKRQNEAKAEAVRCERTERFEQLKQECMQRDLARQCLERDLDGIDAQLGRFTRPLPCCSCPRARIPGWGSVFHLPSDIITLLVTDEPVTTPEHPDQDPRAIVERLKNDAEDVEQLAVELRARYEVARAGLEATDDFGAGAGDVQAKTEGKEAAKNIWIRCRKCKEAHGRERRM